MAARCSDGLRGLRFEWHARLKPVSMRRAALQTQTRRCPPYPEGLVGPALTWLPQGACGSRLRSGDSPYWFAGAANLGPLQELPPHLLPSSVAGLILPRPSPDVARKPRHRAVKWIIGTPIASPLPSKAERRSFASYVPTNTRKKLSLSKFFGSGRRAPRLASLVAERPRKENLPPYGASAWRYGSISISYCQC